MTSSLFDLTAALSTVRDAAKQLNTADQGSQALTAMGKALSQHQDDILEANTLDLEISRDMAVPELVVDWLKLTPERVQTTAKIFQRLASTTPRSQAVMEIGKTDTLTRPVGIVGFIYEAFPDLSAIAAALCIRTGNALVLRGGSEASRTNQIIADILRDALQQSDLPAELIFPLDPNHVSRLEMAQCQDIDLIIPHGRPTLVEQVVETATVPVIPSRMGNCYLYWSASGNLDQVHKMIVSSHTGSPDAVNRIEKVLLHEDLSENTVTRLWNRLREDGFTLKAEGAIAQQDGIQTAEPLDWGSAYLCKTVAFRQVKNTRAAISWINTHSSGHADCIATAEYSKSRLFIANCRSASLYINRSPQFVRNTAHTHSIALGVSDRKGNTGGSIGMSCLQEKQHVFHGS
ncbi:MAG: aldehyde dehydrogenase family protein [Cyanobacteria bacterium J06643_4]